MKKVQAVLLLITILSMTATVVYDRFAISRLQDQVNKLIAMNEQALESWKKCDADAKAAALLRK